MRTIIDHIMRTIRINAIVQKASKNYYVSVDNFRPTLGLFKATIKNLKEVYQQYRQALRLRTKCFVSGIHLFEGRASLKGESIKKGFKYGEKGFMR